MYPVPDLPQKLVNNPTLFHGIRSLNCLFTITLLPGLYMQGTCRYTNKPGVPGFKIPFRDKNVIFTPSVTRRFCLRTSHGKLTVVVFSGHP
jgi:hypothetical protein